MTKYVLSFAAEIDLENILEYGIDHFGEAAAVNYFDCLSEHLNAVTANPYQYPAIDDIRDDYRLCVYKSHSIYFRYQGDEVLIVRILNGQDIEKALELAGIV